MKERIRIFFYVVERLTHESIEDNKAYGGRYNWIRWPIYSEEVTSRVLNNYGIEFSLLLNEANIMLVKQNFVDPAIYCPPSLYLEVAKRFPGENIGIQNMTFALPAKENGDDFSSSDKLIGYKNPTPQVEEYETAMADYENKVISQNSAFCDGSSLQQLLLDKDLFLKFVRKGFFNAKASRVIFCFNKSYFGINSMDARGIEVLRETLLNSINSKVKDNVYRSSSLGEIVKTEVETYAIHEYFVGSHGTNALRKNIPNFSYVFGIIDCEVQKSLWEDKFVCNEGSYTIVYEEIEGVSMREYVDSASKADVIKMVAQVVLALVFAYREIGFIHGDLHTENIIVKKLSSPITVKYPLSTGEDIYIETSEVPVIIDFGLSEIRYKGKILNGALTYSNPASQMSLRDAFKLACTIIVQRRDLWEMLSFFHDVNRDTVEGFVQRFLPYLLLPQYEKFAVLTMEDYFFYLYMIYDMDFISPSPEGPVYGCANNPCTEPSSIVLEE